MKSKRIVTKSNKGARLPRYDFGGIAQAMPELFSLISELSNNNYIGTNPIKQPSNSGVNIESPEEALMKNDIAKVNADRTTSNNDWVKGLEIGGGLAQQLGSMLMSYGSGASSTETLGGKTASTIGSAGFINKNFGKMATGGKVGIPTPIEAEGDEVMETPNGEVQELNGPSHAEGGIDMVVPSGTEIFSKRIKGPDGKSMADRKITREKQEQKLEKLLKSNPSDKALKDTYVRTKQNNEKQEKADMMKMQFAKMMSDMVQQFAFGGTVEKFSGGGVAGQYPETEGEYYERIISPVPTFANNFGEGWSSYTKNPNINYEAVNKYFDNLPTSDDAHVSEVINRPYVGEENKSTPPKNSWLDKLNLSDANLGVTTGDMIGMAGQLYSTFKPMQNTKANRAGDTPNVNAFKNYGKDALAKMDASKQYVNQVRDNQLNDLELSKNSAIKRGRNSARGVNTLRALDLATDANANNSRNQIYNQFAQAMQQIYGQEAALENDQDAKVMQGEYGRDLADRQDRDNYFSQMAEDIATKGTGLQHIGKNVNAIKERNVTSNVMDSLFPDFNMNAYSGKMKKVVTNVASENSEFLKTIPDKEVRDTVIDKVAKREWYIGKDNKVYSREDNKEININKPK